MSGWPVTSEPTRYGLEGDAELGATEPLHSVSEVHVVQHNDECTCSNDHKYSIAFVQNGRQVEWEGVLKPANWSGCKWALSIRDAANEKPMLNVRQEKNQDCSCNPKSEIAIMDGLEGKLGSAVTDDVQRWCRQADMDVSDIFNSAVFSVRYLPRDFCSCATETDYGFFSGQVEVGRFVRGTSSGGCCGYPRLRITFHEQTHIRGIHKQLLLGTAIAIHHIAQISEQQAAA